MKHCLALVALAALAVSSGCQTLNTGGPSGTPHTTFKPNAGRSQFASANRGPQQPEALAQPAPQQGVMQAAYQPVSQAGYSCGCGGNCGGSCGCGYGCSCGNGGGNSCCCCQSPEWLGFCNRYQGCYCNNGCSNPNQGCCSAMQGQQYMDNRYNFSPGPPVGQTAYPYYTVRGPRDFLNPNPPSIGPN